jgi:hypothetical protein
MPKLPKLIEFDNYEQTGEKAGFNEGGFFTHKETGKKYYIKWLEESIQYSERKFFKAADLAAGKYQNRHRNRFNNEILAARIYEQYGIAVPQMEFITFVQREVRYYGVTSEIKEGIRIVNESGKDFNTMREKAQEGFLIDVLLSNYDVVGCKMDNMFFDCNAQEPFRLDLGAALRYTARGGAKKGNFNAEVGEFEDMESGLQKETQFHAAPLKAAAKVFRGVFDSPKLFISLRKLMSVTNEELAACVRENGFDTGVPGNKGVKKNEEIIKQLLSRKYMLIEKAQEKILNQLIGVLKITKERRAYLREAGISLIDIDQICKAIEKKVDIKVVAALIQAVIAPAVEWEVTTKPPASQKKQEEVSSIKIDITDENTHFNQIVRDHLLTRASEDSAAYPKQYEGNSESEDQIQRVKHGGMHASRTALHTTKFVSLLLEAGYEPTFQLNDRDRFLIKVAAMFHDTGRKKDNGRDTEEWELNGSAQCRQWLEERGFSTEDIDKTCEAIEHKDDRAIQEKNIYALILAAADSLDWVRSHGSTYNVKYVPDLIKKYIPEDILIQLATTAKKIAVAQGDSPRDDLGMKGSFDIATKKRYEHSKEGCYSATQEAYSKLSSELDKLHIAKKEKVSFTTPFSIYKTSVSIITTLDGSQIKKISDAIAQLNKEIESSLLYFNKDRKRVKVAGLAELLTLTDKGTPITEAVGIIIEKHGAKGLLEGVISSRTVNLLNELTDGKLSELLKDKSLKGDMKKIGEAMKKDDSHLASLK